MYKTADEDLSIGTVTRPGTLSGISAPHPQLSDKSSYLCLSQYHDHNKSLKWAKCAITCSL